MKLAIVLVGIATCGSAVFATREASSVNYALTGRDDTSCKDCEKVYVDCVEAAGIAGFPSAEAVCKKRSIRYSEKCRYCEDGHFPRGSISIERRDPKTNVFKHITAAAMAGIITRDEAATALNASYLETLDFGTTATPCGSDADCWYCEGNAMMHCSNGFCYAEDWCRKNHCCEYKGIMHKPCCCKKGHC